MVETSFFSFTYFVFRPVRDKSRSISLSANVFILDLTVLYATECTFRYQCRVIIICTKRSLIVKPNPSYLLDKKKLLDTAKMVEYWAENSAFWKYQVNDLFCHTLAIFNDPKEKSSENFV